MKPTSLHKPRSTRLTQALSRRLPCAMAALGLVLALPAAQAMAAATADPYSSAEVSAPAMSGLEPVSVRSREEVKEDLRRARATHTMSASTELGDTPEILQAREDFYALQTEVILAEQAREAEKLARQQQAGRLVDVSPVALQLQPEAELVREVQSRLAAGHTLVLVIETDGEK